MSGGSIDYAELLGRALRSLVGAVLERVADEGLPGEHHFYLTFRTTDPGVEIPAFLVRRYPEEMTIVLEHQFWDLEVDTEAFSVAMRFDGAPHSLRVPFAALSAFVDPAAEFALRFDLVEAQAADTAPSDAQPEASGQTDTLGQGRVVSLEEFRRR